MASAFNWSPGGCCCGTQGLWAIGVDNIDTPTLTRIPRTAIVTYSGISINPDPLFGGPNAAHPCDHPSYLNNQIDTLTAWAPSYSVYRTLGQHGADTRLQMHWATALDQYVEGPAWPGVAGGTPTFDRGRIPARFGATFSPGTIGVAGNFPFNPGGGFDNMHVNYNTLANWSLTHPPYVPDPKYWDPNTLVCRSFGTYINQCEVSLLCGRYPTDDQPGSAGVQVWFGAVFLGTIGITGEGVPLWRKTLPNVPWKLHDFVITGLALPRKQRICRIPDQIVFTPADSIKLPGGIMANAANGGGDLTNMSITVTFGDWHEGPIGDLP